jgi:hypothetical protein
MHYTIEHYEPRYRVGRSVCTPANAATAQDGFARAYAAVADEAEKRRA